MKIKTKPHFWGQTLNFTTMYTQIIQTIVIIIIAAVCVIVPMYFAFQAESKKQAKKA